MWPLRPRYGPYRLRERCSSMCASFCKFDTHTVLKTSQVKCSHTPIMYLRQAAWCEAMHAFPFMDFQM